MEESGGLGEHQPIGELGADTGANVRQSNGQEPERKQSRGANRRQAD